jgi:hypothetical protein
MRWLGRIAEEIWSLFVDDLGLALAVLVWVGLIGLGASRLGAAAGLALFAGLAAILLISVLRRAGQ